jgi:hypothetical protein
MWQVGLQQVAKVLLTVAFKVRTMLKNPAYLHILPMAKEEQCAGCCQCMVCLQCCAAAVAALLFTCGPSPRGACRPQWSVLRGPDHALCSSKLLKVDHAWHLKP